MTENVFSTSYRFRYLIGSNRRVISYSHFILILNINSKIQKKKYKKRDIKDRPMKNYVLVSGIVILLSLLCGFGNALMTYQNDTQLILSSDQIVYGKIVDVKSAWNAQKTHIETTAQIQVTDAFINSKNASISSGSTIPVTIPGGTVGDLCEWVEDQPVFLPKTDAFVFLKKSADGKFTVNGQFMGVHPVLSTTTGISSTKTSTSIPEAERFKDKITKTLQGIPADPNPPGFLVSESGSVIAAAPSITSVSPSSGSAGTDTQITIYGTGFGSTKTSRTSLADVKFFGIWLDTSYDQYFPISARGYPDYTNSSYDIVSWTDTQITVKVPTTHVGSPAIPLSASSGFVFITTDAGLESNLKPFAVPFAYDKVKRSSKAVTYYVNSGTYSGTVEAVQKAAATWNNSGSSFRFNYAGPTTSTSNAYDSTNVISYGSLPAGTLGITYNLFLISSREIIDTDLTLNTAYTWTTGTASGSTVNIEATTAHEFGHWLQLLDLYGDLPERGYSGWPTDTNKMMFGTSSDFYGNMNLKTLSSDDIAGIRYIYGTGTPPTPIPTTIPPTPEPTPILPADYPQKIGLTNGQQWYLDYNGNGVWDGVVTDRAYSFGAVGWKPVTGDWDGNGNIEIGVSNGQKWYLDYNGNGVWDGASTDRDYNFGATGWKPVTGDWNNDGHTNIGITNGQKWYLDYNGDGIFTAGVDKEYNFGAYGWEPVIGKWSA